MPHGSKRKRDEFDDSDEEPTPGRQILPVANLPEDFDDEPMDGLQYLFTVRRDARYLPRTTRVANPYEVPETPIVQLPDPSATHPAMPSEEWRASFMKNFKNFRMVTQNLIQPTIHVHIPQNERHKIMPDKMERDCWWEFLAGRPESDWNPPKKPKSDARLRRRYRYSHGRDYSPESDPGEDGYSAQETWHINDEGDVELALNNDPGESLPTPLGTPAPSESSGEPHGHPHPPSDMHPKIKQREPTPSLITYIDQRTSLHLLMYFTHWINVHLAQPDLSSSRMSEVHARWIFVLLSRVDDYITADDISLLRNLARASLALLKELMQKKHLHDAEQVSKVSQDEEEYDDLNMSERSCWILITAIAGVWGQKDLWMDVDTMLAGLTR